MMFRSPSKEPPIKFREAPTIFTPAAPLPMAVVPVISVPILLPVTKLPTTATTSAKKNIPFSITLSMLYDQILREVGSDLQFKTD